MAVGGSDGARWANTVALEEGAGERVLDLDAGDMRLKDPLPPLWAYRPVTSSRSPPIRLPSI
jgi:hypothetical protein